MSLLGASGPLVCSLDWRAVGRVCLVRSVITSMVWYCNYGIAVSNWFLHCVLWNMPNLILVFLNGPVSEARAQQISVFAHWPTKPSTSAGCGQTVLLLAKSLSVNSLHTPFSQTGWLLGIGETVLIRLGYMGWPSARLFGWSACDWSSPVNSKSKSSDKKRKDCCRTARGEVKEEK